MGTVSDFAARSIYLCVGARHDMRTFLPAVLRGGVDAVQLREKEGDDALRIAQAEIMVPICRDFAVPFIMNDSARLALDVGADGVHVGQDDETVAHCRSVLGTSAIVGLSTHSDEEFDAGVLETVNYLSAGPIVPTPTKAGRAGTGVDYAIRAQARCALPVFVTGGVTDQNVAGLVAAGLRHFVVVRYLTESRTPEKSARALREALDAAMDDSRAETPRASL